jgi:hypothetical protein
VIIPSRKLLPYFPNLCFPVNLLEEKSDKVVASLSSVELLALVAKEQVIGIGSWNRIKRLRLNRPIEKSALAPAETYDSSSTAFACTHMSAFKEALCEVEVAMQVPAAVSEPLKGRTFWPLPTNGTPRNPKPIRVVTEEGEVSGFCYTLPPAPPAGWRTRVLAPTVCSAL